MSDVPLTWILFGLEYLYNGLKSQNTESLFKYIESTIIALEIMNNNVRSDLYVLIVLIGQNVLPSNSIFKTWKLDIYTIFCYIVRDFKLTIRTTMEHAWQKKPLTFLLANNIVRPPTAAGIGMSLQNDVVP